MSFSATDLDTLVRKLTQATRDGKVQWEAPSSFRFRVTKPGGSIEVSSDDEDGNHPFTVLVSNSDGKVVSSAATLAGTTYDKWENNIRILFGVARDQALGVTDVFNSLSGELGLDDVELQDEIPF